MAAETRRAPPETALRDIARHALGAEVASSARFRTGNHHFVHEVGLADGRVVVIRIAYAEERAAIKGALVWSGLLRPRGLPLPAILHADAEGDACGFPCMILERLPGTDLGHVYATLDIAQRRAIVSRLVELQSIAAGLGDGGGFGYVGAPDGPFPFRDWGAVIAAAMTRTRHRLGEAGPQDSAMMRLERRFADLKGYFDTVPPTPFLHDMTSKNVLIDRGRLTGIVDVDSLCYGDPLYLPGLIGAAFIADGLDADYIALWKDALSLTDFQRAVVDFYSAQSLAYIIGETGLPMNHNGTGPADRTGTARLGHVLSGLLG